MCDKERDKELAIPPQGTRPETHAPKRKAHDTPPLEGGGTGRVSFLMGAGRLSPFPNFGSMVPIPPQGARPETHAPKRKAHDTPPLRGGTGGVSFLMGAGG